MRIAYDHQAFSMQRYGGVSRYYFELATRIRQFDGYSVTVLAPFHVNNYLARDRSIKVWGRHGHRLPRPGRVAQKLNEGLVCWKLHRDPPDLVHETYYLARKLASSQSKVVVTVFDMIHEKFPQFYTSDDKTRRIKKAAVVRADHVICISENTRSDLIEILGVPKDKTSVTYLAHSGVQRPWSPNPPATDRPYIVYVGARGGYKNFSGLVQAFGTSSFLKNNYAIICFGGGPITAAERDEMVRADVKPDRVVQTEGDDEVLGMIYSRAAALVYPSLYEGFGLPPLEAMANNCPVVTSKTSSLPEVCGDAAEYFDPRHPESIAEAIEHAVASSGRREELIALGRIQTGKFSWDTCAKQTAKTYRVVSGRN